MPSCPSVRLGFSGRTATICPDPLGVGHVLLFGRTEQSHVDLTDPTCVRHEYLRRIATVLDLAFPPQRPLRTLHLGAGALTLPRYVQATRPTSQQTVVDIERELPGFVIEHLPLPTGTRLEVVIDDARSALTHLPGGAWEAIILDVFTGEDSPSHLTGEDFWGEALDNLAPGGVLLVNVGDDSGLRFFAREAAALELATAHRGLSGAWTLADATLIERLAEGNLVLTAGGALTGIDAHDLRERLRSAGPHPAAVLDPDATAQLVERISAR